MGMEMNFKGWRINILGLIGALLGVIAIFSSWYWITLIGDVNAIRIMGSSGAGTAIPIISSSIFVIGALISIYSSIGGAIELTGISIFTVNFLTYPWFGGHPYPGDGPFLGLGIYLGFISGIIVIISIFNPLGISFGKEQLSIKARLVNFKKIAQE